MIRNLHYIDTGFFKLDGGAMFGVVPKTMWSKLNPPDENNMCTWAMRCILLETESRLILVDTGMGNKQDVKFMSHFHPHGDASLLNSISKLGYSPEDITDVILTHLHFDHCGGAVSKSESGSLFSTFPKAVYWSNEKHYKWAFSPNDREKASFLKENFVPLVESNQLEYYREPHPLWPKEIQVKMSNGHTEAMMVCEFNFQDEHYVYCADLLPSSYHISIPFIMAYDIRPLDSIAEKQKLLHAAATSNHNLIFEHDPIISHKKVKFNDLNKIILA